MHWLKTSIENFLLRHLLNAPLEEQTLIGRNGKLYFGNKVLSLDEQTTLATSAEALKSNLALKVIVKDLRRTAQELVMKKSTNWDDVRYGKALLYVIDLVEKKVDNLSKF